MHAIAFLNISAHEFLLFSTDTLFLFTKFAEGGKAKVAVTIEPHAE